MKNIAIIDADLIGRGKHRFPNLVCMKISGYHKDKGDKITLLTEYCDSGSNFNQYYSQYDKIYVSKVFIDTEVPYKLLNLSNVEYGGSGFFYANATPLPYEIEHHMPDYHLYDNWITKRRSEKNFVVGEFNYYENYSIGFTTRYCNRHCTFCINQHYNKVELASSPSEFVDKTRERICLLDDNVLAYDNWKQIFKSLDATNKLYEFKQGLDIRYLTQEKVNVLLKSNMYYNNIYFAFDNIKDKDLIIEKLTLWRKYFKENTSMYLLCAYDENNKYDKEFWDNDIINTLERIKICIDFGVLPYIMRFRKWNSSPKPFRGMYLDLAAWCNQRGIFATMSLNKWVNELQCATEKKLNTKKLYSTKRYLMEYAGYNPDIAYKYFDLKYDKSTRSKFLLKNSIKDNSVNKNLNKNKVINEKSNVVDFNIKKEVKNIPQIFRHIINISSPYNKDKYLFSLSLNFKNLKLLYDNLSDKQVGTIILDLKSNNITQLEEILLDINYNLIDENGDLYIFFDIRTHAEKIKEAIRKHNRWQLFEEYYGHNSMYCFRFKCIKLYKKDKEKDTNVLTNDKKFNIRSEVISAIFKNANRDKFVLSYFCTSNILNEASKKCGIYCITMSKSGNISKRKILEEYHKGHLVENQKEIIKLFNVQE